MPDAHANDAHRIACAIEACGDDAQTIQSGERRPRTFPSIRCVLNITREYFVLFCLGIIHPPAIIVSRVREAQINTAANKSRHPAVRLSLLFYNGAAAANTSALLWAVRWLRCSLFDSPRRLNNDNKYTKYRLNSSALRFKVALACFTSVCVFSLGK